MRYNIALLAEVPDPFIQEAQKHYSAHSDGYLLSDNSLPHITLAQFYVHNTDIVLEIWNKIQHSIVTTPKPKFIGIGLIKKAKHLWGLSLSVARSTDLVAAHKIVVEILQQHTIQCISNSGEQYRPHLTLARIKEANIVNFNDRLLEDTPFVLTLGQADENGQFLNIKQTL
jgi:2'-5' RNA ligase